MSRKPLVLLAAGGTGGHLFPAEALATVLVRMGVRVVLVTDERVGTLARDFPAEEVLTLPSATPSKRSPLVAARAALTLGHGLFEGMRLIRRLDPAVVVGFGGYPTVPPVLAASLLGKPTVIHEQNGVMGRANRFLARRVSLVATGFPDVKGIPGVAPDRIVRTGNPVRPAVIQASATAYPAVSEAGTLRLLVFGGSQGARIMSEIVPPAIEKLPAEYRRRLHLTQQAREEDLGRVRSVYGALLAQADVQPFFTDLPRRIADSHLVIARSGASTVAELAAIGRPSLLVPLPGALDQDQAANAATLERIGAATVVRQDDFTPERVADELVRRFENPELLTRAALAAKSAGIPDAAERLAAAVTELARIPLPAERMHS